MENKYVGAILIGVALLVMINIFIFNSMLASTSIGVCTVEECPYHSSFNNLIYLSYGIAGLLAIVGLILILTKPHKEVIVKTVHKKPKKKKIDTKGLRPEDKTVLKLVQEHKAIFQADIIEQTGFGKAKVTRIIDRLEGKDMVDRKRRGMTNVVVLKD